MANVAFVVMTDLERDDPQSVLDVAQLIGDEVESAGITVVYSRPFARTGIENPAQPQVGSLNPGAFSGQAPTPTPPRPAQPPEPQYDPNGFLEQ